MSNFCCNRATCPKRKPQSISSSQSSSLEELDNLGSASKATQMSPSIVVASSSSEKTFTPDKNSEKASEANFDGNNQNIRCQPKVTCPSNSPQTSQSGSDVCASYKVNCCLKCLKLLQSSGYNTTPTRKKCTCKAADVPLSSSSTSITSQHFPVKQKIKKPMPKSKYVTPLNKTIVITCKAPTSVQSQQCNTIPNDDQYYSCSSDESESEEPTKVNKCTNLCKDFNADRNQVIVQLLQEVMNLINKESPRQEIYNTAQVVSSNTAIISERQEEMSAPPASTNDANLCPCNSSAQGMATAQVQPNEPPKPEPVVCEVTKDIFKDCCSSSNASNISCKCSNISFVCPVHGSIKQLIKNADLICLDMESQTASVCRCLTKDMEDELAGEKKKETEEYFDEELEPRYVPKQFSRPSEIYQPAADSLSVYEDEEPNSAERKNDKELKTTIQEITSLKENISEDDFDKEQIADTRLTEEINNVENLPPPLENLDENEIPPNIMRTSTASGSKIDNFPPENDPNKQDNNEMPPNIMRTSTASGPPENDPNNQDINEMPPNIIRTSTASGRNIYNLLPEIDQNNKDNQKQIIKYNGSEDENEPYSPKGESEINDDENELAKERGIENREKDKADQEDDANKQMALATIKQFNGEGSEEMKFFIDSVIMDLEAMEYARRRSQFEKKICRRKSAACARESFPATITEVTDLGVNSLYVKWIIHDCCGIGGYEIYTDGYLTNRFYNSRHAAAVITNVDVTLPHKVSLVAQPSTTEESIELICSIGDNETKTKPLPWKNNMENDRKSLYTLWTPSVYLYNPTVCSESI